MFFEYALDPSVLSSWERVRFFLDAFGPHKGRFLAEFPRHWKRIVRDGLNCPTMEKARIIERLAQLDRRVFARRGAAPYDDRCPWLHNARREHERKPFRAIIAKADSGYPYVLDADSVDERNEIWRVESGCLVKRQPREFVQKLALLLDASTRVVIIDPYFRADQPDKTQPLALFCKATLGRATIEVHCSDERVGYAFAMQAAARALPVQLPAGTKVTLHCWRPRVGGVRFHNRYVLTDVGGVQFGDSIESGAGGDYDRLAILDEGSHRALWGEFIGPSPAFDAAGAPRVFSGSVPPAGGGRGHRRSGGRRRC